MIMMVKTLSLPSSPLQFLLLIFISCAAWKVVIAGDADVLLKFKQTLFSNGQNNMMVLPDWIPGTNPCRGNVSKWTGVLCDVNSNVFGLQLENMNLAGNLAIDLLVGLPALRTLSFMNNRFEGPIPDLAKLGALKSLYLSMNKFSGEIPDGLFAGMSRLKKVYLAQNKFSGKIPSSLLNLSMLLELRLDSNQFNGEIPNFQQPDLRLVNVSYNDLEGPIPQWLSNMDASMFQGNKNLCGPPLNVSCNPLLSPASSPSSSLPQLSPKKISHATVATIVLSTLAFALAVIGLILIFLCRKKEEMPMRRLESSKSKKMEILEPERPRHRPVENHREGRKVSKEEKGKLMFVREERERFDLEGLLRSSAEVLGSGNFGSSYKAIMFDGPAVVVKRFKEMNAAGKEDFQEHMIRLGRLSHPNLLPLVAYYFRKEEKLLVTDYVPNGSLAHMLHGNRGSQLPPLDWPTRLKIIKGIASGLAYLHKELPMLPIPHGHLKSSNVLLDLSFNPILTDYALAPVINQIHASQVMVAYKSPEFTQGGKPSMLSDVWSFGILILEILTGKFPANYLRQGIAGTDLVAWVNSVVKEEWTGKVFDNNMKGTQNAEGEMLKLLHVGIACCEKDADRRLQLKEAVTRIEELKERD